MTLSATASISWSDRYLEGLKS